MRGFGFDHAIEQHNHAARHKVSDRPVIIDTSIGVPFENEVSLTE